MADFHLSWDGRMPYGKYYGMTVRKLASLDPAYAI